MTDTNQKQLGNTLWSIADQLRGAMDADDFCGTLFSFCRTQVDQFRGVTKLIPPGVAKAKP